MLWDLASLVSSCFIWAESESSEAPLSLLQQGPALVPVRGWGQVTYWL